MKVFLLIISLFSINISFSQLISGDLVQSGRQLITETDFTIKGTKEGVVVYDLSVDLKGNVTSAVLVGAMTTIKSTPTQMDVKSYVTKLKFVAGNGYPKFHHATIKITVVL